MYQWLIKFATLDGFYFNLVQTRSRLEKFVGHECPIILTPICGGEGWGFGSSGVLLEKIKTLFKRTKLIFTKFLSPFIYFWARSDSDGNSLFPYINYAHFDPNLRYFGYFCCNWRTKIRYTRVSVLVRSRFGSVFMLKLSICCRIIRHNKSLP